jgi:predicted signal transduction protein with EAL and GGDEF domain
MRMQSELADAKSPGRRTGRFGLAARIFLGCSLLALLALWANTLTEERAWREAERVAHAADVHAPLARLAEQLSSLLALYDGAVLARGRGEEPRAVDSARSQLSSALTEYRREVQGRTVRLAPELLEERVNSHLKFGLALEGAAGKRETALAAYEAGLSTLAKALEQVGGPPPTEAALAAETAYRREPRGSTQDDWQEAETALRSGLPGVSRGPSARAHALAELLPGLRDKVLKQDQATQHDRERFQAQGHDLALLVHAGIAEPARAGLSQADHATVEARAKADETRLIGGLAVVVLALALGLVLGLRVARPLKVLHSASRRFAAGDEQARARRGGSPELDELAAGFNRMADELTAARRNALEYSARLEAAVEARTRELEKRAQQSTVTGLATRERLAELIEERLARPEAAFALFLVSAGIDVPGDAGREFDDDVRRALAERLRDFALPGDITAELGPVEFALLREAIAPEEVASLAARLALDFGRTLAVRALELDVHSAVGAALAPAHGQDADALLAAADLALISAKRRGRSQSALYGEALALHAEGGRDLEEQLRQALLDGELELHYQPRVLLPSLELDGVEALVRWRRRDGRLASPTEFLTAAERAGLLGALGDYVLEAAVAQAAAWRAGGWQDARVAVNVSARECLRPGYGGEVAAILKRAALPPWALELELREEAIAAAPEAIAALLALRELGVGIALDDFGRDSASLTAIERLPLTRVKIDRRLIADLEGSARSEALVQSIVRLCAALSLRVVAEGVERRGQLECLKRCGPLAVQGFYFARPMPATEFTAWRLAAPPRLKVLAESDAPVADVLPLGRRSKLRRG